MPPAIPAASLPRTASPTFLTSAAESSPNPLVDYFVPMFTGLVQHIGLVEALDPSPSGARLVLQSVGWDHTPRIGDSISINGCCLTVADGSEPERGRLAFDAVPETLALTTLGALRPGDRVNLEHALRADSLMGGHFVQGHIDAQGLVTRVQDNPADWRVELELLQPTPHLLRCLVPKGSVALDGVSLTIAAVTPGGFSVALIPTTLDCTTLRGLRAGVRCNIETDILARQVAYLLGALSKNA